MAKNAYIKTIEDENLHPYFLTMDDYCFTVYQDLSQNLDKSYTKKLGGANNGAAVRTKGNTVLQMEDIPGTGAGGGGVGVYWDDVIVSCDQGRFYDINGLTAKFVLERKTR